MPSKKNTPGIFLIDHTTDKDKLFEPRVDGERKGHGYDPSTVIPGMFSPPTDLKLIPKSEWSDRIKERKKLGTRLLDIRKTMGAGGTQHKSYDQNGQGFCWAYSAAAAATYARGRDQLKYKRFSAHAVACKIKNWRDEGGWCGLSAQFLRGTGIPTVKEWPEKSMSLNYDTKATWDEALKNRVLEDYVDLTKAVYDQNMTFEAVVTCVLLNIPVQVDFNWWSHSVCAVDVDEPEANDFALGIHNSWTDAWGNEGIGYLRGSQKIPDGAVATRVVGMAA